MFQKKDSASVKANFLFNGADKNLKLNINQKEFVEKKEGDIIFRSGDSASHIYLILDGEIKVKISGVFSTPVIVKHTKNEFFGEKELLENAKRSSSAVANTDCTLYRIDGDTLSALMEKSGNIKKNVYKSLSHNGPAEQVSPKKVVIKHEESTKKFIVPNAKKDKPAEDIKEELLPAEEHKPLKIPDRASAFIEPKPSAIEGADELDITLTPIEGADELNIKIDKIETPFDQIDEIKLEAELTPSEPAGEISQSENIYDEPSEEADKAKNIFNEPSEEVNDTGIRFKESADEVNQAETIFNEPVVPETGTAWQDTAIQIIPDETSSDIEIPVREGFSWSLLNEKEAIPADQEPVDEVTLPQLKENAPSEEIPLLYDVKEELINYEQDISTEENFMILKELSEYFYSDIKYPVSILKFYAEQIKNKDISKELNDVVDLLVEQADIIEGLTEAAHDFAENKISLNTTTISINHVLDEMLGIIADYAESNNSKLFKKYGGDAEVKIDKAKLYQAFFQTAKNACQAMKDGGNIYFISSVEGGNVKIEIKNTGLRIPSEFREKIFEPFFTHGKEKAAGLGLAIARNIINAHGGSITVEGEDDNTRFLILLPVSGASGNE